VEKVVNPVDDLRREMGEMDATTRNGSSSMVSRLKCTVA
jgi:hypothetical protein